MSENNTALAERPSRSPVTVGASGLQLSTLDDMFRFADAVMQSGMAPTSMKTPQAVFVAIQLGMEIGLTPMSSLQNIAVINGRPGIFGDAAIALVRNSDKLDFFFEHEINAQNEALVRRLVIALSRDDQAAVDKLSEEILAIPINKGADDYGHLCAVRRVGERAITIETFTIADAKRAGLPARNSVWNQYPQRMTKFRARGFALRDKFPDVLKGLKTDDELRDYPEAGFADAIPVTDATVSDVNRPPVPVPQRGAAAIAADPAPAAATPPPAAEPPKATRKSSRTSSAASASDRNAWPADKRDAAAASAASAPASSSPADPAPQSQASPKNAETPEPAASATPPAAQQPEPATAAAGGNAAAATAAPAAAATGSSPEGAPAARTLGPLVMTVIEFIVRPVNADYKEVLVVQAKADVAKYELVVHPKFRDLVKPDARLLFQADEKTTANGQRKYWWATSITEAPVALDI